MPPLAIAALSLLAAVSNVTDRVAAERTARLERREAIRHYEGAVAEFNELKGKPAGDGLQQGIKDLESSLPRLKVMADIETRGLAETPELRRDVAFCDAFCPLLALGDDEALRYVRHLEKPGEDLGKADRALFDAVSSNAFHDALALAIARYGCSYTQYVFTYGTAHNVEKLRKAILRRLKALDERAQ